MKLKIRKKTTGNNDSRRKTTTVIAIEKLLILGFVWGRLLTSKSLKLTFRCHSPDATLTFALLEKSQVSLG